MSAGVRCPCSRLVAARTRCCRRFRYLGTLCGIYTKRSGLRPRESWSLSRAARRSFKPCASLPEPADPEVERQRRRAPGAEGKWLFLWWGRRRGKCQRKMAERNHAATTASWENGLCNRSLSRCNLGNVPQAEDTLVTVVEAEVKNICPRVNAEGQMLMMSCRKNDKIDL